LNSLLDKSLVLPMEAPDGEPRFRLLEIVREYAWTRLSPAAATATHNRHRDWFLELAERAGKGLQTAESRLWYMRLCSEEDNLHAAMRWCLEDPAGTEAGLRFAAALPEYWHARGAFRDARAWVAALLARGDKAPTALRARALTAAGLLEKLEQDFRAVEQYCNEAIAIAQVVGDRAAEAQALHFLAHVAQEQDNHAQAFQLYQQSIALFQAEGDPWGAGEVLNCFGDMQKQFGFLADAEAALSQALVLRRSFDNRRGVAATLSNLGHLYCRLHDAKRAAAAFHESLDICRTLGHKRLLCYSLCGYGGVAAIRGEPERAAILLSVGSHLLFTSGGAFPTPDRVDYEWLVAQTRQQMGNESFEAAWKKGQQLSLEQSLAYATLVDER
jgi:non-specific serine/threonine protein kinase